MLKPSAFQVVIEFFNDVSRKVFAMAGHVSMQLCLMAGQFRLKLRPVFPNELVKQRRLGPVSYIDCSGFGWYLSSCLNENRWVKLAFQPGK